MFSQRLLARAAAAAARPAAVPRTPSTILRSPILRRRLMSTEASGTKNAFIKEREAIEHHAGQTAELWKKITIYVAIPALILGSVNAWILWKAHWEHWAHEPPLEERTEYPYQNIRTKNFPWGDGDKTLFWNDKVNYHNKDKQH